MKTSLNLKKRPALDILIASAVFALFHLLGNSADTAVFGKSAFVWMIMRWRDSTLYAGDYSHGWLIPLVSAAALWQSRDRLRSCTVSLSWKFLPVIGLACLIHIAGYRAQIPRLSLFSLILLLWSIPAFLYGRDVRRIITFPVCYLVFCIPLNFLDSVAFRLRIIATELSVFLLNGINIPAEAKGTAILSPQGVFALDVADPCSGIRSLLALSAITVAYAYFFQKKNLHRAILILLSGPLAVAGNVVRIVALGGFASLFGQDSAFHFYHDYSGYIVFATAILLMVAVDKGLIKLDSRIAELRRRFSASLKRD